MRSVVALDFIFVVNDVNFVSANNCSFRKGISFYLEFIVQLMSDIF